ncbi:MAG: gamma carbonic anhydrase family protein [Saezia sp.]
MPIYQLGNLAPKISPNAWVAPSADVIGNVQIDDFASIWFNAVLRGDTDYIHIGKNSNVQDGSILHNDHGYPLIVEPFVTIGHKVMLHSCFIGEHSQIGMQATLLNNCRIGKNSIVAAGALVTENKVFPDGVVIMGAPAKIVREVTEEDLQRMHRNTQSYIEKAKRYVTELTKTSI